MRLFISPLQNSADAGGQRWADRWRCSVTSSAQGQGQQLLFKDVPPEFAHITSTPLPLAGAWSHDHLELHGSWATSSPAGQPSSLVLSNCVCVCVCVCGGGGGAGVVLLLEGRRLDGRAENNEQCQPQHQTLFLIIALLFTCEGCWNHAEPQFYLLENRISRSCY